MEPTPVGSIEDAKEVAGQLILLVTTDNFKDKKVITMDVFAEPTITVKSASDEMMKKLNASDLINNRTIETTVSESGSHPGREFTIILTLK